MREVEAAAVNALVPGRRNKLALKALKAAGSQLRLLLAAKRAYLAPQPGRDNWSVYVVDGAGDLKVLWPEDLDRPWLLPLQLLDEEFASDDPACRFKGTPQQVGAALREVNPELKVLTLRGWEPEEL
jgi:hypothetical protein